MNRSPSRFAVAVVLAVFFFAAQAFGEMSVSVTISGPIEEIVALLQHLKNLGIGQASAPSTGPYKVTITSVATASKEPEKPAAPQPPQPPPPPPKPALALSDAKAEPAAAKVGTNILVTVKVSDPDHLVDTISATVDGMPGSTELYDNGTHGDAAAGDGTWSGTITLAPPIAPGEHAVNIAAFNTAGNPVMKKVENAPPVALTAQLKVTVQP
jgi:hypothetical protein